MAKNNKKVNRNIDRNLLAGPWKPLEQAQVPADAAKMGVVACFQNNRYTIFVKEQESPGFGQPGPDGKIIPMKIAHLIINRNDKKTTRSWADLQRIKNELLGPMAEAIELFPAEWRRMSDISDRQTHLWALSPGATLPLGLVPAGVDALAAAEKQAEEHTLTQKDVQVYVVKTDEIIEVFADETEARAMYKESGNEMPEGEVKNLGDVPSEDEGAGWTERAKAKIAQVMRKAEQMEKMMRGISDGMDDEGDDAIVIEDNPGPRMVEDDLADDRGYEDGKPSVEEFIDLERLMREGIAAREIERKRRIEAANKLAKETEEAESKARDELAEMREKMVKGQN